MYWATERETESRWERVGWGDSQRRAESEGERDVDTECCEGGGWICVFVGGAYSRQLVRAVVNAWLVWRRKEAACMQLDNEAVRPHVPPHVETRRGQVRDRGVPGAALTHLRGCPVRSTLAVDHSCRASKFTLPEVSIIQLSSCLTVISHNRQILLDTLMTREWFEEYRHMCI